MKTNIVAVLRIIPVKGNCRTSFRQLPLIQGALGEIAYGGKDE
ncbi:hypothetical protein LCGC14_2245070 [marine sediment metagenome]|uniref:Uncharacterized protein n=1 Tax=marine sediment metagenome TaxID=412755 RepID=A0A0F9FGU3_9ZZZZ